MMKSGLMTADQSSFFSIPLSSYGFIALSEKTTTNYDEKEIQCDETLETTVIVVGENALRTAKTKKRKKLCVISEIA